MRKFHDLRLFGLPLAALFLLITPLSTPVSAQTPGIIGNGPARTLTLSATGSVDTKPDMASINTGIETEAVRARDALDDNNEIMARMMKSLKDAGLEDRDIATTHFNIAPRYQHFKNGRAAKIVGYRVTSSLRITVRNLDNTGRILDRLVTLGSNRISGIRFGLSHPDRERDKARLLAMRKVLDRADLYARAAHVRLGPITSISEQTTRTPPRAVSFRTARALSAVPLAPGQQKTSVTVHVTWALAE